MFPCRLHKILDVCKKLLGILLIEIIASYSFRYFNSGNQLR